MTDHKTQSNEKCATIALLGIPNVGKSTLINTILGEKIAAVHRKPQMTRKNLLGLLTEGCHQLIFIDTPGLHESKNKLNQKMILDLFKAIDEADVVAVLLEVNKVFPTIIKEQLLRMPKNKTIIFLLNKIDLPLKSWKINPQFLASEYGYEIFPVSAKEGKGIAALVKRLKEMSKQQPFCFDSDNLTTTTYRELARDCIREKVMQFVHHEIPYQLSVIIDDYKEMKKRVVISAVIVVNKDSQKAIVIGVGGKTIQKIIKTSHLALKQLTGCHVRIKIFVKVDRDWIKNEKKVEEYH